MNSRSLIPDLNFQKRANAQALTSLEDLLELIPRAVLLADLRNYEILRVNGELTKISFKTRDELITTSLNELLPDLTRNDYKDLAEIPQKSLSSKLVRRSGESMWVEVQSRYLPGLDQFAVLIQDQASLEQASFEKEILQRQWQALHMLSLAPQEDSPDDVIAKVLEATHTLLLARMICLYLPDKENPGALTCAHYFDDYGQIPFNISSRETYDLGEYCLWMPGSRTRASIHRSGVQFGYLYIASLPIFAGKPENGILAVGCEDHAAPENLELILRTLAATLLPSLTQMQSSELELEEETEIGASALMFVEDVIDNGLIYLDRELRIIRMNDLAENTLGFSSAEVTSRHVDDILVAEESLHGLFETALGGTPSPSINSIGLHTRGGEEFPATVRIYPLPNPKDPQAETETLVVVLTDISESEANQFRIQQLEQRAILGEFAAIFAHEVKNPINNLSLSLQMLLRTVSKEDPAFAKLLTMQEDLTRLSNQMEDVLTFARTKSYDMKPILVSDLIQGVVERWKPRLSKASITPVVQLYREDIYLRGDRQKLEQVFNNLISNAVRAMSETGQKGALGIKVKAGDKPDFLRIDIADTGPGIAPEIQERIFQPFFTTNPQGTGIGLALVQSILSAHRGSITVESVPAATVFTIHIPQHKTLNPEKRGVSEA